MLIQLHTGRWSLRAAEGQALRCAACQGLLRAYRDKLSFNVRGEAQNGRGNRRLQGAIKDQRRFGNMHRDPFLDGTLEQ
jgi:hypothetical protein